MRILPFLFLDLSKLENLAANTERKNGPDGQLVHNLLESVVVVESCGNRHFIVCAVVDFRRFMHLNTQFYVEVDQLARNCATLADAYVRANDCHFHIAVNVSVVFPR